MEPLFLQQHQGRRYGRNAWLFLVLMLSVTAISADGETKGSSVRDLRADLFRNYNKLIRPVVNQKTATPVSIAITPLAVTDLDEEKHILELDSWIYMKWTDEYLVWNPENYDGVTTFNIPSTEIWRPDITIYSGTPAKKMVIEVLTNAIVNYTGDVLWVPPVTIRNRCPEETDSSNQPDSQTCTISIGSWTYSEYKLDLQNLNEQVKLEHFRNSDPNWELISFNAKHESKYYSCCVEPYSKIDYKITIKRKRTGRASRKCPHAHQMSHMMPQNYLVMPSLAYNTGCH